MNTLKTALIALFIALLPTIATAQAGYFTQSPPPFAGTSVIIGKNTTTALQMIGVYMYNWDAGSSIPAFDNASAFQQIDTVTLNYCGAPTPYGQQVFLTKVINVPTGAQNPTWQNSAMHGPGGIVETLNLNNIGTVPGVTLQGLVHVYDPGTPVPWSVCIVRIAGHWITHVWNNLNQDNLFNGTSTTTVTIPR